MSKFGFLFGVVVVGLLLSSCSGAYAVKSGIVTEYIMNTEERTNGSFTIWMGADTVTSYCTLDKNVYELAKKYQDDHVLVTIEYSTINFGDKEGSFLGRGCDHEKEGTVMLKLNSLRLSSSAAKTMTAQPR